MAPMFTGSPPESAFRDKSKTSSDKMDVTDDGALGFDGPGDDCADLRCVEGLGDEVELLLHSLSGHIHHGKGGYYYHLGSG